MLIYINRDNGLKSPPFTMSNISFVWLSGYVGLDSHSLAASNCILVSREKYQVSFTDPAVNISSSLHIHVKFLTPALNGLTLHL